MNQAAQIENIRKGIERINLFGHYGAHAPNVNMAMFRPQQRPIKTGSWFKGRYADLDELSQEALDKYQFISAGPYFHGHIYPHPVYGHYSKYINLTTSGKILHTLPENTQVPSFLNWYLNAISGLSDFT